MKLTAEWQKSTRSGAGGACVEARQLTPGGPVDVRHSKRPTGPVITFTLAEWRAFTDGVAAGEMQAE